MLDKEPCLWGTLLFTNADSTQIVIDRVTKRLQKVEILSLTGKHNVTIEVRIGRAKYDETIQSPFHFLEQAKKEAEYDV